MKITKIMKPVIEFYQPITLLDEDDIFGRDLKVSYKLAKIVFDDLAPDPEPLKMPNGMQILFRKVKDKLESI